MGNTKSAAATGTNTNGKNTTGTSAIGTSATGTSASGTSASGVNSRLNNGVKKPSGSLVNSRGGYKRRTKRNKKRKNKTSKKNLETIYKYIYEVPGIFCAIY